MRALWRVVWMELLLLWRGRGVWVAALATAALGALQASMIRQTPWGAWNHFVFTAMLSTLLLAFTIGDQIHRDRDHRLDGVLLSTPIPTAIYVIGKYLAALAALLGLAGIGLAAALLLDRFEAWPEPSLFLGQSDFPSLGTRPYLIAWGLLVLTPLLFGAALMFAGGTLAPGGRVAASLVVLALWLILPLFVGSWPAVLDVTALGAQSRQGAPYVDEAAANLAREELGRAQYNPDRLSPVIKARIVRSLQGRVPPPLPGVFFANRALFLGLAGALIGLTVLGVAQQRQGRR